MPSRSLDWISKVGYHFKGSEREKVHRDWLNIFSKLIFSLAGV